MFVLALYSKNVDELLGVLTGNNNNPFYGFYWIKALVQYCEIHISHYPIILFVL